MQITDFADEVWVDIASRSRTRDGRPLPTPTDRHPLPTVREPGWYEAKYYPAFDYDGRRGGAYFPCFVSPHGWLREAHPQEATETVRNRSPWHPDGYAVRNGPLRRLTDDELQRLNEEPWQVW